MNKKILKKILFEFNSLNFQNAYDLAININKNDYDIVILKILTISSFKIQKYTDAIKFGMILLKLKNINDDIEVLNIIGTSYSITQDYDNGNKFYEKYLENDPENLSVNYNLGLNYFNQKKFKESKNKFNKIISNKSDYRDSELLYGIIQSELKNYKNAIKIFKKLIEKNKYLSEANYNLGVLFQKKEDYLLSIKYFEKAIKLNDKQYQYFNSLGISYQKIFNYKNAKISYNQAINLNSNYSKAYSNLGFLNQKNGFFKEALNNFDRALKMSPKDSEILYNKSICLLEYGNFKDGLKLYKWRQKGKFLNSDKFKLSNIKSKKILVKCDQGLGDIILLSRFVKLLPKYGAVVTFQIPASMKILMKYLNKDINIITQDTIEINYDYKCTLGDLLEIFNINLSNIPLTAPYLEIDNKWIKKWKNKLDKNKFNIGVAWQGKKGAAIDEG